MTWIATPETLKTAMVSKGFDTTPDHINDSGTTRFSTKTGLVVAGGDAIVTATGNGFKFHSFRLEAGGFISDEGSPTAPAIMTPEDEEKEKIAGYWLQSGNASRIFGGASPATRFHPYLSRKEIQPYMTRVDAEDRLIIPVMCYPLECFNEKSANGLDVYQGPDGRLSDDSPLRIISIQYIFPNGSKRFLPGCRKKGGHLWIGEPQDGERLLLCEGFATGASIHEATGHAVCVCFDAGNLKIVAGLTRKYYPTADIVICGDDDRLTKGNPGRNKAAEAAKLINGRCVFPCLENDASGSDFNDMALAQGLDSVKILLDSELTKSVTGGNLTGPSNLQVLPEFDARDGTTDTFPLTELGNALRLQKRHGADIRYIQEVGRWLVWRDNFWEWDVDGAYIRRLAMLLPEQIYSEGAGHLNESELFVKWARASQRVKNITDVVSILKDFESIRCPLAQVDACLFSVGLDSAKQILDLQTGNIRVSGQSDLITKSLRANGLGHSARAVRWHQFLNQVFDEDPELINWLQKWCGYLLTGSTSEQVFLFCYGLGSNGKSILVDVLLYILGDYSRVIPSETLTESNRQAGSASPDLAALIGSRLVVSSETEEGKRLNEAMLKSVTGDASLTARPLYREPLQFSPQFKLMMTGNHRPIVSGSDFGIWRRIILLPFQKQFKGAQRDAQLLNKLKEETPHILAWMIEGCLKWQISGLGELPAAISQATSEYKSDQDLTGQWLEECCALIPEERTLASKLYQSYRHWSEAQGMRPLSNIVFGRKLAERGFTPLRSGQRFWLGIFVVGEQ